MALLHERGNDQHPQYKRRKKLLRADKLHTFH